MIIKYIIEILFFALRARKAYGHAVRVEVERLRDEGSDNSDRHY